MVGEKISFILRQGGLSYEEILSQCIDLGLGVSEPKAFIQAGLERVASRI